MQFIKYSVPLQKNFLPIEHIAGQAVDISILKDNFIRTIFTLKNQVGAPYLYSESLARWPFGEGVDRLTGLFYGRFFNLFFVYGWASGTVGGPEKALLKDENGKIIGKTEKIYCKPSIKTKDIAVRLAHVIHSPSGEYRLQLLEYPSSVDFFSVNGIPKRELELCNTEGVRLILAGVRNAGREVKIYQTVPDMHILLSLFISLHIPYAFYRYP